MAPTLRRGVWNLNLVVALFQKTKMKTQHNKIKPKMLSVSFTKPRAGLFDSFVPVALNLSTAPSPSVSV